MHEVVILWWVLTKHVGEGGGGIAKLEGRRVSCYLLRETGDLMRPEVLGADGVVRVTLDEEVLEETHVLQAEQGDLVLWLDGCCKLSWSDLMEGQGQSYLVDNDGH